MNFSLDDFFSLCYNEINILSYRMKLLLKNTRGCIMKKLAIVAFALVLAMTFVGCGAQDPRFVGTWDYDYRFDEDSGKPTKATRFEFKNDGSLTTTDGIYNNGVWEKETGNSSKGGNWLVVNGDYLEIEGNSATYNKKWLFAFSKRTLILTEKGNESNAIELKKVTVKATPDAE